MATRPAKMHTSRSEYAQHRSIETKIRNIFPFTRSRHVEFRYFRVILFKSRQTPIIHRHSFSSRQRNALIICRLFFGVLSPKFSLYAVCTGQAPTVSICWRGHSLFLFVVLLLYCIIQNDFPLSIVQRPCTTVVDLSTFSCSCSSVPLESCHICGMLEIRYAPTDVSRNQLLQP